MVLLEFEKPSTWSIGQKIGVIAIVLLLVGPFLPYWAREYSFGNVESNDDVAYSSFDNFGLFILIPLLSAFLIAFLLYFKLNICIEKDGERIKINHFILMFLGFWLFLTYLADALRIMDFRIFDFGYIKYYAGYGLWMIVIGYLLCAILGIIEWRYPTKEELPASDIAHSKKIESEITGVGVVHNPDIVSTAGIKTMNNPGTINEKPTIEPAPNPGSPPEPVQTITVTKEPSTDHEKTLLRWARHINKDGQTFEQCIKCANYTFINGKDEGDTIVFNCPDCGSSFTLKKK